jgi:hypothetical protein
MLDQLRTQLGQELVDSPFLSVMILATDYHIVWHNDRFAQDFGAQPGSLVGRTCHSVLQSETPHDGCPLLVSLLEGKRCQGWLDFGDRLFFYLTVPLDAQHAAKVHVFLPRETGISNVL